MRAIRKVVAKTDIVDLKGLTIRKGLTYFVMREITLKNPMDGKTYRHMVIRVDNGTGILDLMPETCIREEVI